jgi:diaminopimelate decarboxylase
VIAEAVARADGPTLVFDRTSIATRMQAIATAARSSGVRVLFAAKSFPHPAIRVLAAEILDGFDVASADELRMLPPARDRIASIADPTGTATADAAHWPGRTIIGCDTAEQVAHVVAAAPRAEIAIRLSASLTDRDHAVGGILEGSGRRRSRFGLDVDPARRRDSIVAMSRAAVGRPIGVHVHHGAVLATTAERFVATARAALAIAAAAELAPRFLDLGGAWHGIPLASLASAFAEVRAAVPAAIELIVEPGRAFVDGAGFATGRVLAVRDADDRALCVTELSRSCHLRWSQPELVAPAPRPGHGRDALLVGPTCYEDDVLGEWTVEPAVIAIGAHIIMRNVTGYAVAWNLGFAGTPPATVEII